MSSWVEKEGGWRKNVGGERMWVENVGGERMWSCIFNKVKKRNWR